MKQRFSNPVLADRGCRLAGIGFTDRLVPRPVSEIKAPSQENAAAAGAPDLPAPAAFSRYTESCPGAFHGQASAAPDVPTPASGAVHRTSHAINLPEHVMVLVRAIAAYERCSNERAAVLALAEYAAKIGAGPLARAVLDLSDDLADVPDFPRRANNRFRGGP
ncbi:hypothetical protein [Mesorhizobium sp.]|uniref:hypothetical protein n=1 Tax=Mesorhizobium sp. TaxID=1871066 RepID=UPI000FE75AC1|nr:hypothetical protein [Mesorhizobium sp.]RWP31784.1 MAG: hypothetical protein EOR02_08180 [Mesorhizobium sp.]TIM07578.1 MAG: hypothetical protein E5Y62_18610 [Mesorhizobium sp.]